MLDIGTKTSFNQFARSVRRCESLLVVRWYNLHLGVAMPPEGLVRFLGVNRPRATHLANQLVHEYEAATRREGGLILTRSGKKYLIGIWSTYGIEENLEIEEQLKKLRKTHPVYLYGIPQAKVRAGSRLIPPVKFAKAVLETMEPWERLASALAIASDFDKVYKIISSEKTDTKFATPARYYSMTIFNVPLRASRLTSISFLPNLTGKSMRIKEVNDRLLKTWYWPEYIGKMTLYNYIKECGQFDLISHDETGFVKPMLKSGLGVVYEVAEKVDRCFRLAPGQVALAVTPIYYVASHGLFAKHELMEPNDSTEAMGKLYNIQRAVGKSEYARIVSKSLNHMETSKVCEILGSDEYVVPQALLHKIKTWKHLSLEEAKRQLERALDGTEYVRPIVEYMMKEKGAYVNQLANKLSIGRTAVGSILDTLRGSGLIIPTSRGKQYPIWLLPTRESADILSRDVYLELYGVTEEASRRIGQESVTEALRKLVLDREVDIEALGFDTSRKYELARYFGRLEDYMLVKAVGSKVMINVGDEDADRIMDLFVTSWAVGDVLDANIDDLKGTYADKIKEEVRKEAKDTRENIIKDLY